jgi:hypothetical protein
VLPSFPGGDLWIRCRGSSNPAHTFSTWPRCGITGSGGIHGSPGGQASAFIPRGGSISVGRSKRRPATGSATCISGAHRIACERISSAGSARTVQTAIPHQVIERMGRRLSALSNSNPSLVPRLRASGNSCLTIASDPFETSHPWFRRPSIGSHSFRLRNDPKGLPVTTPFLTSKSFKCNLLTDLVGTVWHL